MAQAKYIYVDYYGNLCYYIIKEVIILSKLIDLTGMRFGKWTVLERDGSIHPTRWICKCDCGAIRSVSRNSLQGGSSSCGLCSDKRSKNQLFLRKHSNRLYHAWSEMKRRCDGKCTNHQYYGDKGISYCSEWQDFDVFAKWAIENGYQEDLEIDRIDGDMDYCPENCRWVSHKNNSRNRKARKNNVTGVAGVYPRLRKDGLTVYRAFIKTDEGKVNLGTHYTIESAAKARKDAELKYWGFNIGE